MLNRKLTYFDYIPLTYKNLTILFTRILLGISLKSNTIIILFLYEFVTYFVLGMTLTPQFCLQISTRRMDSIFQKFYLLLQNSNFTPPNLYRQGRAQDLLKVG